MFILEYATERQITSTYLSIAIPCAAAAAMTAALLDDMIIFMRAGVLSGHEKMKNTTDSPPLLPRFGMRTIMNLAYSVIFSRYHLYYNKFHFNKF